MNADLTEAKLTDFGIAKRVASSTKSEISTNTVELKNVMTPRYSSPEILEEKEVGVKCDIYSFAILL